MSISVEEKWADSHYGRAKCLYMTGGLLESAVELLIAFRLDEAKRKQFENEFPNLAPEDSFRKIEEIVIATGLSEN